MDEKKRNYSSWRSDETLKFVESVQEHHRNFKKISEIIGGKDEKQVRYYYYRLLKRISKYLLPDDNINSQNDAEVAFMFSGLIEVEKRNSSKGDIKSALLDKLIQFRDKEQKVSSSENTVNTSNNIITPNLLLSNDKVTLMVTPLNENVQKKIVNIGHKPHLSLIVSKVKKMQSIIQHINKKWQNAITSPQERIQLFLPQTGGNESIWQPIVSGTISDLLLRCSSYSEMTLFYQFVSPLSSPTGSTPLYSPNTALNTIASSEVLTNNENNDHNNNSDYFDSISPSFDATPIPTPDHTDIDNSNTVHSFHVKGTHNDDPPPEISFLTKQQIALLGASDIISEQTTSYSESTVTQTSSVTIITGTGKTNSTAASQFYMEESNDIFEPSKKNMKYEKISREYWHHHEQDVDFGPPRKKQKTEH